MAKKLSNDQLMSQAARDIQMVEFAYQYDVGKTEEEKRQAFDQLPPGVELLMVTDFVDDTEGHDYRCAVFKDTQSKRIIFANAGTRITKPADLIADVRLGLRRVPRKAKSAEVANQMVLDSLGDEAKDYQFHYTGHSLGAAMADISASNMAVNLRKRGLKPREDQLSVIGFDNPGTKGVAERVYTQNGFKAKQCTQDVDFNVFNTTPNLVNRVNKQVGREHRILPDNALKVGPVRRGLRMLLALTSKVLALIVKPVTFLLDKVADGKGRGAYLASLVRQTLLAPSNLIKIFSLGEVISQVKSHSTTNFINVFNKQKGDLRIVDAQGKVQEVKRDYVKQHAIQTQGEIQGRETTARDGDEVTTSPGITPDTTRSVSGVEVYSNMITSSARDNVSSQRGVVVNDLEGIRPARKAVHAQRIDGNLQEPTIQPARDAIAGQRMDVKKNSKTRAEKEERKAPRRTKLSHKEHAAARETTEIGRG